jgi:hypothetical protein
MMEEWKSIDNFPNYAINNFGIIKRIKSSCGTRIGHVLKFKKDKYGYLIIGLWKNKKRFFKHVGRLVLENFKPIENSENYQCNHIDGNKTNNLLENLEWSSPKENTIHSIKMGLRNNFGEKHNLSKLKNEEVWLIKKILNSDYYKNKKITQEFIGKIFKVSRSTITSIKIGKTWTHIGD